MEVNGKTKIYHANLFKQCFERDEDVAGVAVQNLQIDSYMTGLVTLDEEEPKDGDLDKRTCSSCGHCLVNKATQTSTSVRT